MEYKRIFSSQGDTNTALSVCFSRPELLSMGVQECADELDPEYIGKTELSKLVSLWKDPLYLAQFFETNSSYFSDPFWKGVTEEIFVGDVVQNSRVVFKELLRLLESGQLVSVFEPLDKEEDSKRRRDKVFKVKAKYGHIAKRVAFRIYGIMVDENTVCITGGAIKIVKEMSDAPNTEIELKKMERVASNIFDNGIFDKDSFIDFIAD